MHAIIFQKGEVPGVRAEPNLLVMEPKTGEMPVQKRIVLTKSPGFCSLELEHLFSLPEAKPRATDFEGTRSVSQMT